MATRTARYRDGIVPHTRALLSRPNAASWITGQVLDVNGGKVMV
jgi:NAD(P)-dependent dehydrogenase (short-subunit alcohol dehydrogenase family)